MEIHTAIRPFLKIEDLLLPLPLPALMAILLVLGVIFLANRVAQRMRIIELQVVDCAACFILTTAILTASLHLLALLGLIFVSLLRVIGSLLAFIGLLQLLGFLRSLHNQGSSFWGLFREFSSWTRVAFILSAVILICLFFSMLGPPTDVDSLDYHLGVPLDWIRHGSAYPRPDWFHARLVGIGEMINLLGLAMGTDCLGATFQFAGLIIAIVAVTACGIARKDLIFGSIIVVACPVIVFLTLSQKPQLLPCAATALALTIIVRYYQSLDFSRAVLASGCASFAIGCKYSFLISGSIILTLVIISAIKVRQTRKTLIITAVFLAFFAFPIFLRNLVFYGDPLSPMLGKWLPDSDPALTTFAYYLRNFGGPHTFSRLIKLPWHLLGTTNPMKLTTVLGIGVLAFLVVNWRNNKLRLYLIASLLTAGLTTIFGQLTARFYLEPYFWCAAAACGKEWGSSKNLLFKAITLQAILVAGIAVFAFYTLFPAALMDTARDHCMDVTAEGYAVSKWINETIPPGTVLMAETRANALLPRAFICWDVARFLFFSRESQQYQSDRLIRQFRDNGVSVLIHEIPIHRGPFAEIKSYLGERIAGPARFSSTARNPFMRAPYYWLQAHRLIVNDSKNKIPP